MRKYTSIEVCAGAGGQALGLEMAGFNHVAAVEIDKYACATLRENRPHWNVYEGDLDDWIDSYSLQHIGVDLVAGGIPCPPFSVAGRQLGNSDERDLFPVMVKLVSIIRPRAVMIENVKGLLNPKFKDYRQDLNDQFSDMGYTLYWKLLQASDYGVPQLRPRVVIVGIRSSESGTFQFPTPQTQPAPSVGEALKDLMGANAWKGLHNWVSTARTIAPTLVGGSKKHGGPDLGPTRARQAWAELGINGSTLALDAPDKDFEGMPRLTVPMAARIQGFPDEWKITGMKTNAYRQVGNAFPPPVAAAVGREIISFLKESDKNKNGK